MSADYPTLPFDNQIVRNIRVAVQKTRSYEEFWAFYVLRRFSIYLSVLFAKMPVLSSPNSVTVLGIIGMLLATKFALTGNSRGFLLACFFYHFSYLLDCVDGEVARLTNRCSKIGKFLDIFLDSTNVLLLFGFAYGSLNFTLQTSSGLSWLIFISFVGLISFIIPRLLVTKSVSAFGLPISLTTQLRHSNLWLDVVAFLFSPPGLYTLIPITILFSLSIELVLKIYAIGLLAKTLFRIGLALIK
ncbi:MAG: CDP-alcohol phosphatidyltransferase family protein [candidate division WOR-3 bacterium]